MFSAYDIWKCTPPTDDEREREYDEWLTQVRRLSVETSLEFDADEDVEWTNDGRPITRGKMDVRLVGEPTLEELADALEEKAYELRKLAGQKNESDGR